MPPTRTDRCRVGPHPDTTIRTTGSDASLVGLLRGTFRWIIAGVVVTLVVTGLLGAVLLGWTTPELERLTALTRALRVSYEATLEEEAALRHWMAASDDADLAAAVEARRERRLATATLAADIGDDPALIDQLVSLRVAQERWASGWADVVVHHAAEGRRPPAGALGDGRELLTDYRDAYDVLVAHSAGQRDRTLDRQRRVLATGVAAEAAVCLGLLVLAARRRHRVQRTAILPLVDLAETIRRVKDGDLGARTNGRGPQEIREVAVGFAELAEALVHERELVALREGEAIESERRLREVLTLARDIAGSLSVRYVAESVGEAVLRVSGAERVVLWAVADDGAVLHAVHDTGAPRGTTPSLADVALGVGPAGLAARDARTVREEQDPGGWSVAFPTVVGARVTGAIEVRGAETSGATDDDALETLAIHAGAALEAARLHQRTEELSQADGLTGLLNRRRLEGDLAVECDRANRYQRPLSFVMLDIDHFKALNDTRGHQHGDEVLQLVAGALADTLRTSDTVYRYGGEEFAVLVRESDVGAATLLAERLRKAVEQAVTTREGFSRVTASFGVAELGLTRATPDALVAAADAALYAAKRGGRNRVVVDDPAGVDAVNATATS